MSERRWPRRTLAAGGVVLALLVLAAGWWVVASNAEGQGEPLVPVGPPIVKGGVEYVPVGRGGPGQGEPEGYAVGIRGGKAEADLKAGRTVVVPGPKGGSIEIRPIEPTPPPPGEKK